MIDQKPPWISQNSNGKFSILPSLAAENFVEKYQGNLIFHQNIWWEWNTKIWVELEENRIKKRLHSMLFEDTLSKELTKSSIIDDIQKQIRLMLSTDENFPGFDNGDHKIIFKNGTLNISKVHFSSKHNRDDYKTIMLGIDYDPESSCPRWMKFLEEIGLDPDTQDVLQMWCGYLLVPSAKLQRCLFLLGEGSNGKGVFLMTLQNMLGPDNCSSLEMAELFDRFKVSRLRGKLVNIASDIETSKTLDARFKKLVAGEPQVAEQKFRDSFEFRPYARLLFSANEFIPTRDRSHGFFRRFDIIKFERTFKEEEKDLELEETLRDELSGIFMWCLLGLQNLIQKNWLISPSEKMKKAHAEFKQTVTPLITYADQHLKIDPSSSVETVTLRNSYSNWCSRNGYYPLSEVQFGKELKRLFPTVVKKRPMEGNVRRCHYIGLTLN